jgi:hypothetical protein
LNRNSPGWSRSSPISRQATWASKRRWGGSRRECQATLTAAERQIELLTGIQPDGTIRTEAFPDQV